MTNTGNVTLHDLTLHDDRLGTITCPETTLAPGASTTCHARHVTTTADVDAGRISNTAIVTGHSPTGPPVTDGAKATVTAIQTPAIHLVKSAFPTQYGAAGEIITYTYAVTNTGNVTLRHVAVTDDEIRRPIVCLATTLSPGESTTCHAPHVVTAADVAAGHITNVGTVTGNPPAGRPVTDKSTETVDAIRTPGIQLEKTAWPTSYRWPGETITYTYTVVNTGDLPLRGITVTDDKIPGPIACPASMLDPGKSMTCHATYITTATDVTVGHVTNVATATGRTPNCRPVTDRVEETVTLLALPIVPVTG